MEFDDEDAPMGFMRQERMDETKDPSATIDTMVANLAGLEARAKAQSKLPPGVIVPQEGAEMFAELSKLQSTAEEKMSEIEKLKVLAQGHSAAAFDIDKQMSEIEADHGDKIGEIERAFAEERFKTQKVLQTMRESKDNELRQIEEKEKIINDLSKVITISAFSIASMSNSFVTLFIILHRMLKK
jgi:thiol:disulfide interchange protein